MGLDYQYTTGTTTNETFRAAHAYLIAYGAVMRAIFFFFFYTRGASCLLYCCIAVLLYCCIAVVGIPGMVTGSIAVGIGLVTLFCWIRLRAKTTAKHKAARCLYYALGGQEQDPSPGTQAHEYNPEELVVIARSTLGVTRKDT